MVLAYRPAPAAIAPCLSVNRQPVQSFTGTTRMQDLEKEDLQVSTAAPPANPVISAEQRRQLTDQAVTEFVASGWRVESRSEYQATFAKGHRHSHGLHLFLTIVTLGLWLFVWIPLAMFGGEKRRVVWVDEYGQKRGR